MSTAADDSTWGAMGWSGERFNAYRVSGRATSAKVGSSDSFDTDAAKVSAPSYLCCKASP